MIDGNAFDQPDGVLALFLNSASEEESYSALTDLITGTIQPQIKGILRNKIRASLQPSDLSHTNQDALEIVSEVRLHLVSELRKLRTDPNTKPIRDLKQYTSSVTINAFRQYLRKKYPLRHQLRSKLRYLLNHHPKFALWHDRKSDWLCGLLESKNSRTGRTRDPASITSHLLALSDIDDLRKPVGSIELLTAIFRFAEIPILFDNLLTVVAEIQAVKDQTEARIDDPGSFISFSAPEDELGLRMEMRGFLEVVWKEISKMPLRHRLALILNLRDKHGDCVVWLLPLLRIASVRQIAEALEFEPKEFASVWKELPWKDERIAEFMGLSCQQVINLRQSARARLSRILKKNE